MPRLKTSKRTSKATSDGRSRGRSGGRSGAAGYDFQDLYVALQLTKLLMGDRDPLVEVMWEKKSLDLATASTDLHVYVDDVVVRVRSGRCIYVQVKQTGPGGSWTPTNFTQSGVALQLWNQWLAKLPEDRPATALRIASASDVTSLKIVIDAALRSRTPAELLGDEASEETVQDVYVLAKALSLAPDSQELLDFLKSLQAEHLPEAEDLEGLIIRSLSPFGQHATDVAQQLIRLVARSKHAGPAARSSHDHTSLLAALRESGVLVEWLIAAGLLQAGRVHDIAFWDAYRNEIVKSFRTFRVYGLHVDRAVFADLPSLFVPLKLAPIAERKQLGEREAARHRERRSLSEAVLGEFADREAPEETETAGAMDLSDVLREKYRFGLIGGPGSGKTTTLKWLALVSALPGTEGKELRAKFGLPTEPLLPLFVRFRRLADRIQARGLDGIAGRVGLVAEFLAAELEAGLAGKLPSKQEALEMAEELLQSDNCIFLFDALDEVPDPSMRSRLFDAVADLMQRYPKPRVVLSSRPYAFREDRAPIELPLFEPLSLNRTAQRVFARQWYRAVRSHVGDGLSESAAEARAEDLTRAAESLADLSENPLLLSILALVHFNRQGLPVERSTLYDHATLAMLGHWERDPAGRDLGEGVVPAEWAPTPKLPEAVIRRVVEYLAREVQHRDQGGGEFSRDLAVDALATGLERAALMSAAQATQRADALLRILVERTGMIQERSPGVFGFVHLSFQDYLAARWFVGAGEQGLSELADLAREERHAEVVRFAVAILAADQRAEADERALRLVREVATRDAALAAACLLEAPRLQLSEDVLQQLARRVWSESASMWKRHHHPVVGSRLVWTVLERSTHANELLLEFLTLDSGGHRDGPDGEMPVSLLVGRPPIAMSPRLVWVLRQVERAGERRSWLPAWSIAALLLIEAGAAKPEDHLPALVRLLGEERWNHPGRGSLRDRAERILEELASGEMREEIQRLLEGALDRADDDSEMRVSCGAAKLLLVLGMTTSTAPAEVLVQQGLRRSYRHAELIRDFRALLVDPRRHETIMPALVKGLKNDNEDVRRGSARVLRECGISTPPLAVLVDEDENEERRGGKLRTLISDPSQAASAMAALTEALWDEDEAVAWRATKALIDEDRGDTPGVVQALVRVGLGSEILRSSASDYVQRLRREPRLDLSVRGALLDGLRSESAGVATASAVLLTDIGETRGEARVARITRAMLRDPKQLMAILPRLEFLLAQQAARSVAKAVGEYLGGKDVNAQTASACAELMVESGQMNTQNLAKTLVVSGLADDKNHDRIIFHLRRLLDDPKLVTDVRKALAEGLASESLPVAWGSARCLWEVGSRSDSQLAAAIIKAGLTSPSRRKPAHAWLLELLGQPRTAAQALPALEEAASEAASLYRGGRERLDLAWEIACCLLSARIVDAEHFAEALVRGGLGALERHDHVVNVMRDLLSTPNAPVQAIEEELWLVIGRASRNDVGASGAARVLIEADFPSVREVMASEKYENEKRAVALIKTLLGAEDGAFGSKALGVLANNSDSRARARKALSTLLKDEDADIAYGAARWLIALEDPNHRYLPAALIRGGLAHYERRVETKKILDGLSKQQLVAAVVTEALQQALWGDDAGRAYAAAEYLMDQDQRSNPGVARGLVFGGMFGHRHRGNSDIRVWTLLADPVSRPGVVDALSALLLGEERGYMMNAAALLVLAGEHLSDRLLAEFDSEFSVRHSPFVPLAALALSGRVDEARERAQSLGLQHLLGLLGEEPLPGATMVESVSS